MFLLNLLAEKLYSEENEEFMTTKKKNKFCVIVPVFHLPCIILFRHMIYHQQWPSIFMRAIQVKLLMIRYYQIKVKVT